MYGRVRKHGLSGVQDGKVKSEERLWDGFHEPYVLAICEADEWA